MKRQLSVMGVLLLVLAGCTDTPDTVSREYRNLINECIDALMCVQDEASAKRMMLRVFKPATERFKDIDNKLKAVRSNRTKGEFVKEVFLSDSVHLYLTELEVNKQRRMLELSRVRRIYSGVLSKESEEAEAAGREPRAIHEYCKNLQEIAENGPIMQQIEVQLKEPKLVEEMKLFSSWKVGEYDKLLKKYLEKRKTFEPREPIILVN